MDLNLYDEKWGGKRACLLDRLRKLRKGSWRSKQRFLLNKNGYNIRVYLKAAHDIWICAGGTAF
jgi:hypothetical protein